MKLGGTNGIKFKITKRDTIGTGNNPHYVDASSSNYYFYNRSESFLDLANPKARGISKWLDPNNHHTVNGPYLEYSYDAYVANNSEYNIKLKPSDSQPFDFLRSSAPIKLNYIFNFNNHFKLYNTTFVNRGFRITAEQSVFAHDIIAMRPSASGVYVDAKDTFASIIETKWSGSGRVYTFNYDETPLTNIEDYGINVYNSENDLILTSQLNISTAKILDIIDIYAIADFVDNDNYANSRYSEKVLFTKKYDVPNDMIAIVPITDIGLGCNVNKDAHTFDYVYSMISLNNSTITVKQAIRNINYVQEFGKFYNNILWNRDPLLYRLFEVTVSPQEIVYAGQSYNKRVKFAVIDLSAFENTQPNYTLPSKFGS